MKRVAVLLSWLLLPLFLGTPGCNNEKTELQLGDLTTAETQYLTRIVILERAKAVALVDRENGSALLDSLATAWGDSSMEKTIAGAPTDPHRSVLVHSLLARILTAERDSLMAAPRSDRLSIPLQDPPPDEDATAGQ
jgi:hypothetical protein